MSETQADTDGHERPHRSKTNGDMMDVFGAYGLAGLFMIALAAVALYYRPAGGDPRLLLFLSGVVGAAFGWATGIMLTPYDAKEDKAFKAVYALVTGYVVAKIDPAITAYLQQTIATGLTEFASVQFAIAATAFVVTAVTTFVSRRYWKA